MFKNSFTDYKSYNMILISHRGNISGRIIEKENHPEYIDIALRLKYDVEVDLWANGSKLFLGHDSPEYEIDFIWIGFRKEKLWLHCKNMEAIEFCNSKENLNYFWHETDTVTLTSKKFIWAYPGKQPIKNSISVLPELNNDDISECIGVCSDFILNYKNGYKK